MGYASDIQRNWLREMFKIECPHAPVCGSVIDPCFAEPLMVTKKGFLFIAHRLRHAQRQVKEGIRYEVWLAERDMFNA